ncbi:MAG: hypothetical protein R3B09_29210 [Nannocystaceae bacterium]
MIGLGLVFAARRGRTSRAAEAVEAWSAAALIGAAIVGALVLLWTLHAPRVGAFERPPAAMDPRGWLPLAALFAGLPELTHAAGSGAGRGPRFAAAALLVVATVAVAGSPALIPTLEPLLGLSAGPAGVFDAWILGVGEQVHRLLGIDRAIAEACVAAVVVAGAAGLCVRMSRSLGGVVLTLLPGPGRLRPLATYGAIAGLAAALCVSRQSDGGALLLGPALLLSATVVAAWVTHASLGRRRAATGILLLCSAAATLWAFAAAWSQGASPGPLRGVYLGLGAALTLVLAGVALLGRPRSGP